MREYIWLFPIIFVFHDLEEIIGMRVFLHKNKALLNQKYPYFYKLSKDFSTEGFALAVLEEFVICLLLCLLAVFIHNEVTSGLWLGAFIACTLHFFIHIIQTLVLRKYIPATITSILCLPISIWIIYKCISQLEYPLGSIFPYLVIGFVLVGINLFLAQKLIGIFTRFMNKHIIN